MGAIAPYSFSIKTKEVRRKIYFSPQKEQTLGRDVCLAAVIQREILHPFPPTTLTTETFLACALPLLTLSSDSKSKARGTLYDEQLKILVTARDLGSVLAFFTSTPGRHHGVDHTAQVSSV
jgi:hypothetical protein